jgi:flagellar basal body-associated protein FliL
VRAPSVRCDSTARKGAPGKTTKKAMWVTLNIVTLASLLAALGYVAFAARKLDASLGALLQKQSEERCRMERERDRVRATTLPGC